MIWDTKNHTTEGIFRVSASAATLKASRASAEAGEYDRIQDGESAAQLIKQWIGELPQSVFGCAP